MKLYEWFNEQRSLAGGLIFGGSGLGGVLFPIMVSYLLERVGYRWTLRIWAGMFVILGSLAMLGAKPRILITIARGQSRPYNVQRYFTQFRFVRRPLFILNVVPTTISLMTELDDFVTRIGVFPCTVVYAYVYIGIGSSTA